MCIWANKICILLLLLLL